MAILISHAARNSTSDTVRCNDALSEKAWSRGIAGVCVCVCGLSGEAENRGIAFAVVGAGRERLLIRCNKT